MHLPSFRWKLGYRLPKIKTSTSYWMPVSQVRKKLEEKQDDTSETQGMHLRCGREAEPCRAVPPLWIPKISLLGLSLGDRKTAADKKLGEIGSRENYLQSSKLEQPGSFLCLTFSSVFNEMKTKTFIGKI